MITKVDIVPYLTPLVQKMCASWNPTNPNLATQNFFPIFYPFFLFSPNQQRSENINIMIQFTLTETLWDNNITLYCH